MKTSTKNLKTSLTQSEDSNNEVSEVLTPAQLSIEIQKLWGALGRVIDIMTRQVGLNNQLREAVGNLEKKVEWYRTHPSENYVEEEPPC